jgi:transcriptional regulator with XRE-family HTH domain
MDWSSEIRDFLTSRRARVTPEQAGVPAFAGVRRVPGLRREEVAHAAGISVDYYNRLERGKTTNASPEILDAIARTLQLDPTEHDHLFDLFVSTRRPSSRPTRRAPQLTVRPTLQRVIDGLDMPAFIESPRLDILAANHLGRALYTWPGEDALVPFNVARYLFLDPRAAKFYLDWESMARNQVALLRTETGRDPAHPELIKLIGELSTHSERFRTLWAAHDVRKYREGPKRFHHPIVGDLEFIGESLDVSNTPGLFVLAYTIEPGSPTAEAMTLLASWAASPPDRQPQRTTPDTADDPRATGPLP